MFSLANPSSGKYIWFNQGFTGWPLEFGRLLTNIFFSPYYSLFDTLSTNFSSFYRLIIHCFLPFSSILLFSHRFSSFFAVFHLLSSKSSTIWQIIDYLSKKIDYRRIVDIIDSTGRPDFIKKQTFSGRRPLWTI